MLRNVVFVLENVVFVFGNVVFVLENMFVLEIIVFLLLHVQSESDVVKVWSFLPIRDLGIISVGYENRARNVHEKRNLYSSYGINFLRKGERD